MEELAFLAKNEKELVERVEEYYEEEVELKSRNDPTGSQSVHAKRFWTKVRRVLPNATVKKLSVVLMQRRAMREQYRREVLVVLLEDDEPPTKRSKRVCQRNVVVPWDENEPTPRKQSSSSFEESDESLQNQSDMESSEAASNKSNVMRRALIERIAPIPNSHIMEETVLEKLHLDLRKIFPDSDDFSRQVEHIYNRYVPSGKLAAQSFWRYLKDLYPGDRVDAVKAAIRRQRLIRSQRIQRRRNVELHIADCTAQLPSKLLVSVRSLVHISDPKELQRSIEAIYNEWSLLPRKCTAKTFWAILKLHAPASLMCNLPARLQQRKQDEKRKELRAQGLHRNGTVRQYKRPPKYLTRSLDLNAQDGMSSK